MWLSITLVSLYFLAYDIHEGASIFSILLLAVYFAFFSWGVFLALTKPDVLIMKDKIYLYGRLTPTPLIVSRTEIQSIERHSETPIWRVSPLSFLMRDGSKLLYSTGANESRMRRIMKFIETEATVEIRKT